MSNSPTRARGLILDSEIFVDRSGQPNTVYFMACLDEEGLRPFDGVCWTETGRVVVDRHAEFEGRDS